MGDMAKLEGGCNYITNENARPIEARLIFDLKCNAGCAHCCESSGPYRTERMEDGVFRKVADSLSSYKLRTITFSGGESTIDFERLLSSVKYLRKEAGYAGEIIVQTNAHWAMSEDGAEKVLLELKDAGVDSLDIPSIDKYHEAKFNASENAPRAGRIARKLGFSGNLERTGPEKVIPIGRAKTAIPETEWDLDSYCDIGFGNITVDTRGNVYPCCWHQTPPIGNITEKTLDEILDNARKNSVAVKMAEMGFKSVPAEMLGISKEEKTRLEGKLGACGTCSEYFSKAKGWPKP